MNKSSFELSVLVPNSKDGRYTAIREYGHNGFTYVEGRAGQKFAIRIKNNSAARILAITSIDGLSVLDGKAATPQSRGYIVPAYSAIEVEGWRTSLEDINDFVFDKKGKSYTEGVGNDATNCGVIAVMLFEEFQKPKPIREEHHHHHHHHHDHYPVNPWPRPVWPRRPYYEQPDIIWCATSQATGRTEDVGSVTFGSTGAMSGSAPNQASQSAQFSGTMMRCMNMVGEAEYTSDQKIGGATSNDSTPKAPSFNLGTAFGEHRKSKIGEENFKRGANLGTLEIYYTDADGLREVGIDVTKKMAVSAMPQAFQAGFCVAPITK